MQVRSSPTTAVCFVKISRSRKKSAEKLREKEAQTIEEVDEFQMNW